MDKIWMIAFAVAFPLAVFFGGGLLMHGLSDRQRVEKVLEDVSEEDRKPLNRRLGGYSTSAVDRHWKAIKQDEDGSNAEIRFLELDLVFPFFYGAAFATSLLIVWGLLGRPISPVWIPAPVALAMIADWVENLLQLREFDRYVAGKEGSLSDVAIGVASVATQTKLFLLGAVMVALLVGVGLVLIRTYLR